MARPVSKYKIKLRGKEKQELRQAKKQGRKNARLVIRVLITPGRKVNSKSGRCDLQFWVGESGFVAEVKQCWPILTLSMGSYKP